MPRLLHCLHTFPPETRGGVQGYVERIARAQAERGDTVAIACATSDAEPRHDGWNGLDVHRIPALDPFEQLAAVNGEASEKAERWTRLIAYFEPDVVHVHHWQGLPLDLLARVARARPAARRIATLHDFFATDPTFFRMRPGPDGRADEWLAAPNESLDDTADHAAQVYGVEPATLRAAMPARQAAFVAELGRAQRLLCPSRTFAEYWSKIPAFAHLRPEVLPLPMPAGLEPVPPAPRGDVLHVGTWGGLVRGKGLHVLLDAVARLPASSVRVHHLGPELDAEYAAQIRAHAMAASLTLHGPFDMDGLREAARGFHLAVFPSLYLETHGMTVDEALALGLPVLVPDRGAPQERVDEDSVFRVGDAAHLASRLAAFVAKDAGAVRSGGAADVARSAGSHGSSQGSNRSSQDLNGHVAALMER
ncbi:D-inositol-3-phosphate glycosyltransferase [Planctomycetes bacterium Pla163]|uniref:D-inositol-3-phosphate glycosyltransferase n=1 Tax=Rohdeia mirabilis TaxID=2528008 RepID=A0A518CW68_9BACT|nr:D-inositol-3-phosphate glycosyltransferase [Planctomycetes bacterium Pla163]